MGGEFGDGVVLGAARFGDEADVDWVWFGPPVDYA